MVTGIPPLLAVRVTDWFTLHGQLAELGVDRGAGVGEHGRLLGRAERLGLAGQDEVTELETERAGPHGRRRRIR